MTTIKSHTDIPQSKKLAKFLPLESADMCYRYYSGSMITGYGDCVLAKSYITGKNVIRENDLPCWSLAKLLDILPKIHGVKPILDLEENSIQYTGIDLYVVADNSVDACYKMIVKLNELKML
jgi:hypothetical protein